MKLRSWIAIGSALMVIGLAQPAKAMLMQLEVTYSNLTRSGPISLGFTSDDVAPLPESTDVIFVLEGVGTSPGVFDISNVLSASLVYGTEVNLDETDLSSFDFDTGGLSSAASLTYQFNPFDSLSATNVIVFNSSFQLNVTGTDRTTSFEPDFDYFYSSAEYTFRTIPEPSTVALFAIGLLGFVFMSLRDRKRAVTA